MTGEASSPDSSAPLEVMRFMATPTRGPPCSPHGTSPCRAIWTGGRPHSNSSNHQLHQQARPNWSVL